MSFPKRQRIEHNTEPIPWEIVYLRLALDCDFPILEAITKSIYSTTTNEKGTIRKYRNNVLYYKERVDGIKKHYKAGQLHREDGPAIQWANGDKSWYRNGQLHREDGPAIEWADGRKAWYRNGQLIREDGSAVILAD